MRNFKIHLTFYLYLIIFFLQDTSIFAQGFISNVIPPSPSVCEFEKFSNYSMSNNTGVINVTIPLYTVQIGKIKVPIELDYITSGIKYGQTNGDVGLGWTLNPLYRVSRTMLGKPDEHFLMQDTDPEAYSSGLERDQYLAQFYLDNGGRLDGPMPAEPCHYYDGQFDIFSYDLLSDNGNFIMLHKTNDRTIKFISESTVKLSFNQNISSKAIEFFIIYDGNGIEYTIGKDKNTGQLINEQVTSHYLPVYTSWFVTEIKDEFNNFVKFTYDDVVDESPINNKYAANLINSGGCQYSIFCTSEPFCELANTSHPVYQVRKIKTIETRLEKIVYYRNNPYHPSLIDSICVYNNQNQRKQKFVFNYSTSGEIRLLDAVNIYSENCLYAKTFKLDYYGSNYNGFFDLYQDYWGYLKVGTVNPCDNYPNELKNLPIYIRECKDGYGFNDVPKTLDEYFTLNIDKHQYGTADIFSLKRITYPTGGYTEYSYEPNFYGPVYAAGIRIADIETYDSNNSLVLQKNYKYGINGIGNINFYEDNPWYYLNESIKHYLGSTDIDDVVIKNYSFYTQPNISFKSIPQISNVVNYSKITEILVGKNENQKTEFYYSNSKPFLISNLIGNNSEYIYTDGNCAKFNSSRQTPELFVESFDFTEKPYLEKKIIYKLVGQDYIPVQQDEFFYSSTNTQVYNGIVVAPFASAENYHSSFSGRYYGHFQAFYEYGKSSFYCKNRNLTKKVSTLYFNGLNSKEISLYNYNSLNQIIEESVNKSTGEFLKIKYKYPSDYGIINTGNDEVMGLKNMQQTNLINIPVETIKETYDSKTNSFKVISGNLLIFKKEIPSVLKSLDILSNAPLSDFSFSHILGNNFVYDSNYKPNIYTNYNSYGNLIEFHKENDIPISYLWGYNYCYPVAKIVGANYVQLTDVINPDDMQNLTGNDLINFLSRLKTIPNTLIEIYTYLPLVGLLSYTDSNGRSVFYKYDEFMRLNEIKDDEGKIIKKIVYHYKNQ